MYITLQCHTYYIYLFDEKKFLRNLISLNNNNEVFKKFIIFKKINIRFSLRISPTQTDVIEQQLILQPFSFSKHNTPQKTNYGEVLAVPFPFFIING